MTEVAEADAWLIVKRDLYYRPGGKGYTGIRDHAGRYSYEEAKSNESPNENGNPVTIVKLTDAPQFAKACFDDLARDHLIAVVAERDATIRSLSLKVEELEKGRWQDVSTAPPFEELLLCYPPDGKTVLKPKYGVGGYSEIPSGGRVLWDWQWGYAPKLFMRIHPPSPSEGGQLEPILPTSSPSPHGEPV